MDISHVTAAISGQETEDARPLWRRLAPPLITAGLGIGTLALLHLRDPHVQGSYGVCPSYALLGVYCPGCGGMRAIHNLTDGRIVDALHSNLLAVALVVAFAAFVLDWTLRARRGLSWRLPGLPAPAVWTFFGLLAVYSVLRNTPWGTWFTPV
ncbi:DUF2752 domain-containing protein [Nocardia sp. NPDC059177]|uniref:DUF2752 domain-containing protein n=1 Tax=Nocardia sp. NPDC059177 TaxID=3346759 RepID=UPI0036AC1014